MGVGVYESNFNGTGRTFIVSPVSDSYVDYVESMSDGNEDDILSEENYYQDEADDLTAGIVECISSMGNDLGFVVNDDVLKYKRNFNGFIMDDEFISIIENKYIQVGFRGWESDIIIGVASAKSEFENIPENYQLIDEYFVPLKKLEDNYQKLSQAVYRYAILALQEGLCECRQKTSGYTTSLIDPGEGSEIEKERLAGEIQALVAELDRPQIFSDSLNNPDLRNDFTRDIYRYIDEYCNPGVRFLIPYVALDNGAIEFADKDGDIVEGDSFNTDIEDYFAKQNIHNGFHEIPLNDETRAFFKSLQVEKALKVDAYVSADEYRGLDSNFELKADCSALSL